MRVFFAEAVPLRYGNCRNRVPLFFHRLRAFAESGLNVGLGICLFIVRPHTQDTNRSLFSKNFVHDAVLNIDAA